MHRCVYHGRQCYNIELGQMVQFDELPEPVKKKVATIEARVLPNTGRVRD